MLVCPVFDSIKEIPERLGFGESQFAGSMKTLWYMGAKGRLVPDISEMIADITPKGQLVFDIFGGTGAVSQSLVSDYTVYANDVQCYSSVVLGATVEHGPRSSSRLRALLNFDKDIRPRFDKHKAVLLKAFKEPIEKEREGLREALDGRLENYRRFVQETPIYPCAKKDLAPLWKNAAPYLTEDAFTGFKGKQSRDQQHLMTSYYQGVYFSLEQAIELDSLRVAISEIEGHYAARKRRHYLAALLCAASTSTSGTSHFAQPRNLKRDRELKAVAKRRASSITGVMKDYSGKLKEYLSQTKFHSGNKVYKSDYRSLLSRVRRRPATIYADPPYTSDNYSRFYHVLEVLARYDYPRLARRRDGQLSKGRYPERDYRFQSGFCAAPKVENEFRRLAHSSSRLGSSLVVSYALPTGLLFKRFLPGCGTEKRALQQFLGIFRECYKKVSLVQRSLMHSGQGDSNHRVSELLVRCRLPRKAAGCAI
ncbi:MAG: DNA adenine methylase [Planctomycetota bacterium]|nr:DNA adenine methylase [Planctomycetota bacterium]